jgi:hypothetical protein
MMKPRFDSIALAVAAVMMALAPVAVSAAPQNKNLGASRGGAKTSVNRGGGGGGNYAKPNGNKIAANNGNKNRANTNNRTGTKPNRNGNNVVAGNTVVVGQPNRGGYNNNYNNGYYSNGRYYNGNNGNWDNNDDDFLEFVGKTAAVTAGVSVVAAVIGSTTKEKPSDCQQTVSNGQVYMNCNGTWYQPIQSGGQTQYQVIAPPQ